MNHRRWLFAAFAVVVIVCGAVGLDLLFGRSSDEDTVSADADPTGTVSALGADGEPIGLPGRTTSTRVELDGISYELGWRGDQDLPPSGTITPIDPPGTAVAQRIVPSSLWTTHSHIELALGEFAVATGTPVSYAVDPVPVAHPSDTGLVLHVDPPPGDALADGQQLSIGVAVWDPATFTPTTFEEQTLVPADPVEPFPLPGIIGLPVEAALAVIQEAVNTDGESVTVTQEPVVVDDVIAVDTVVATTVDPASRLVLSTGTWDPRTTPGLVAPRLAAGDGRFGDCTAPISADDSHDCHHEPLDEGVLPPMSWPTAERCDDDSDCDGLSDQREHQLAQAFGPTFVFDQDEPSLRRANGPGQAKEDVPVAQAGVAFPFQVTPVIIMPVPEGDGFAFTGDLYCVPGWWSNEVFARILNEQRHDVRGLPACEFSSPEDRPGVLLTVVATYADDYAPVFGTLATQFGFGRVIGLDDPPWHHGDTETTRMLLEIGVGVGTATDRDGGEHDLFVGCGAYPDLGAIGGCWEDGAAQVQSVSVVRHSEEFRYRPEQLEFRGTRPELYVSKGKHATYASEKDCESHDYYPGFGEACSSPGGSDRGKVFTPPYDGALNVGESHHPTFHQAWERPDMARFGTELIWDRSTVCGRWCGGHAVLPFAGRAGKNHLDIGPFTINLAPVCAGQLGTKWVWSEDDSLVPPARQVTTTTSSTTTSSSSTTTPPTSTTSLPPRTTTSARPAPPSPGPSTLDPPDPTTSTPGPRRVALPDLAGLWINAYDVEYDFARLSDHRYRWTIGEGFETGEVEVLDATTVRATWNGSAGSGGAEGVVTVTEGVAWRIDWNNGQVFERLDGCPPGTNCVEF
jgi:hypothetical protein